MKTRNLIRAILNSHYNTTVCDADIKAEIANLARKQAKGNLDDRQEILLSRIEIATGSTILELRSSTA